MHNFTTIVTFAHFDHQSMTNVHSYVMLHISVFVFTPLDVVAGRRNVLTGANSAKVSNNTYTLRLNAGLFKCAV